MSDEHGLPLSIVLDGANRHDSKLLADTLDSIVITRPEVTQERPQNLCLDAGYTGKQDTMSLTLCPVEKKRKQKRKILTLKHADGLSRCFILI